MNTPAPPAMTKMPRPTTTTPVESPSIAVKKKQRAITSRNDPSSASLSGVLRVIRYGPEGRFVLIHGKGSGGRSFGGAVGGWLLMGSSKQRRGRSAGVSGLDHLASARIMRQQREMVRTPVHERQVEVVVSALLEYAAHLDYQADEIERSDIANGREANGSCRASVRMRQSLNSSRTRSSSSSTQSRRRGSYPQRKHPTG